jgi:hypothetical protein
MSFAAVRTWLVLALIGAYRLTRCAVVWVGAAHALGAPWASALVLLAACARWTVLLQIGAAATLIALWGWPAPLALIIVAPRLITVLPGLIRTWGASVRHPRPRWSHAARADDNALPAGADLR